MASDFGATTLAAGESTTFTVRLEAAALGTSSGQISFTTNDADESPFDFTVNGSTPVGFVDDAGASFAGNWYWLEAPYYEGATHYALAGAGSSVATWQAPVAPGQYRVAATWQPSTNRASDAPYTILDGSQSVAAVEVNQQVDRRRLRGG